MKISPPAGIILAAGKGTRMKSNLPKGLHQILGVPMIELVGRAMRAAGVAKPVVVIGFGGDQVQQQLGDSYEYVWQREQLGTGHAVRLAIEALPNFEGPVLVAVGDAPLITEQILSCVLESQTRSGASVTVMSMVVDDPTGYGRIVRDASGRPLKIVEQKDASEVERAIREVNASLYCFEATVLRRLLPRLTANNAQSEYYLTDLVEIAASSGEVVDAEVTSDPMALMGVNDRWQLSLAEETYRERILVAHAMGGVTLTSPATIRVGPDVVLEPDVTIEGPAQVLGRSRVREGARIMAGSRIVDSDIGARTTIVASHVDRAMVGEEVWIGPFANIRPDSEIGNRARIGNFVETKNSHLSEDVKVSHLSYIGDASIGTNTNIGAGTITVNYDGFDKHRTEIGENAFVGSNSTLISPLKVGDGAFIVAGSVVTDNVPEEAGAFGRSRQVNKEGWAKEYRRRKQSPNA